KEIKVWASLDHENVVPLLGYFTVGNNKLPRLVSSWMEDGTMTDYMRTFPRCSFLTQKMLIGIASGLAFLHEKGVVHADLKTPNILISKAKTPLLTDFGLSAVVGQSKSTATRSSTNNLGGTVRWMAREFFVVSSHPDATHKHDKKTDVWAYGMVIYARELTNCSEPFIDF
ncbi:kinase-like protein, partial [Schizopora paradoxa]